MRPIAYFTVIMHFSDMRRRRGQVVRWALKGERGQQQGLIRVAKLCEHDKGRKKFFSCDCLDEAGVIWRE